MKKLFILVSIIILTSLFSKDSWGQSKSTTPTNTIFQQQIDELKNKIASKVAELKLVEKRGIMGTVSDVTDTQITLIDPGKNIKIIDVDELTKFYSSSDSYGISDVKKGQTIGVLGLYNKESRRILAREVNDIDEPEKIILGIITNIDKENYELAILNAKGEKTIIVIEDTTKSFSLSEGELSKSGFSKTKLLETVIVAGFKDTKSPTKLLASKLLLLQEVSLAKKLNIQQDELNNQASSSANSK